MSGRFLALLLLLAVLSTAATYLYTAETKEILSDPGLSDLERRATVHGWPWGYYAKVKELVRYSERQVAVMEYNELRFEMLGKTYLAWLVTWLITVPILIVATAPRPKQR